MNTSSANVLHKLGFTDEAVIPYECSGGEMITEGGFMPICNKVPDRRLYEKIGLEIRAFINNPV